MRVTITTVERDRDYHEKTEREQIVTFENRDDDETRLRKREQVTRALKEGERWVG